MTLRLRPRPRRRALPARSLHLSPKRPRPLPHRRPARRRSRRLQLRVVAEGVEFPEQVSQLAQWNPDIVLQGMLLGKPVPQQQWMAEVLGMTAEDGYSGED